MTTENTNSAPEPTLVFDDSTIMVIRDLLQLCLLTQSNFVDFVRAIRLRVVDGKVAPTDEYVSGYNNMIQAYAKEAEENMKAARREEEEWETEHSKVPETSH